MKQFIYIVGRTYPQAASIRKIKAMGYHVGIFLDKNVPLKYAERYDRVITLDFSSFAHLTEQLQNEKNLQVDGLICIYENYVLAKSELARFFKLPASSLESARLCTDKYLMRNAFMEDDRSISPHFARVTSEAELLQFAKEFSYPVIIKPTNLVKSLLVLRCNNDAELISNYAYAKDTISQLYRKYRIYDREPQLIVEQYIVGSLCSVATFVDHTGNVHFCEGITTLTTAQDRGIDDNYLYARTLPGTYSKERAAQLLATATKGVQALGMRSTPAHVELIYNDEGVKLIEIGARIGGYRTRMYQNSYGLDLIEQEVNLAVGKPLNLNGTFNSYCGVYELFPQTEGAFESIQGLVDPAKYSYFSLKAIPGEKVGPAKNGYKATAVLMVSSADTQAFSALRQSIDNLEVSVAT